MERISRDMKRKQIRKYFRRADDCMEQIERKLEGINSMLFFLSMGMEYFHQKEECPEAKTVQCVRDYLKTMRTGEIASLHEVLEQLKKV